MVKNIGLAAVMGFMVWGSAHADVDSFQFPDQKVKYGPVDASFWMATENQLQPLEEYPGVMAGPDKWKKLKEDKPVDVKKESILAKDKVEKPLLETKKADPVLTKQTTPMIVKPAGSGTKPKEMETLAVPKPLPSVAQPLAAPVSATPPAGTMTLPVAPVPEGKAALPPLPASSPKAAGTTHQNVVPAKNEESLDNLLLPEVEPKQPVKHFYPQKATDNNKTTPQNIVPTSKSDEIEFETIK